MNLPTGFGRSLISQCLSIAADPLFKIPHGSSVVVVISPLRSLMEDRVGFILTTSGSTSGRDYRLGLSILASMSNCFDPLVNNALSSLFSNTQYVNYNRWAN